MSDIREYNFYNRYPLSLISIEQRFTSEKNLYIKEYELYYETPTIKFYTILDIQTTKFYFLKRLKKYLEIIIKQTDEYIDKKYPNIYSLAFNYDIVVTYIFEGIMKDLNKFLVFKMMIIYQLIILVVFKLSLLFHLLKFLLRLMYI